MTLAELRKLSIRKQLKIRFQLPNGMECVVNEHGVAQLPALRHVPDFNLEQELKAVSQFVLEPARVDPKSPVKGKPIGVAELAALMATGPSAGAAVEHEEE
ncbi:MAG: hypothetical protein LAP40_06370 [Acidobacteriia bacterium]|nr:hypothetical protein [Terriglobia bacterium]